MTAKFLYTVGLCLVLAAANSQQPGKLWHGKERRIHYKPVNGGVGRYAAGTEGFELVNGRQRFNRALYGTNTAFRVEAGDLPEFALYMPGMGGNLKFGIIGASESKWLIDAAQIKTKHRPGTMEYEIRDPLLKGAIIYLAVNALAEEDGMIIKVQVFNAKEPVKLLWAFGGATGRRFSRDGDIGADPESSFYLQPEYCRDNQYSISDSTFKLFYGAGPDSLRKRISGIVPSSPDIRIVDAAKQESPLSLFNSQASATPALAGTIAVSRASYYFLVKAGERPGNQLLAELFSKADEARRKLANRVEITTPDQYINSLGAMLSLAADAIWENPSFLHGAVAWRMRLPAWRGAYAADPLGWHDRARTHFDSYALSQVITPATAPVVMDTALHLARHLEKIGTGMFTSGYICRNPNGDIRPHHYDMNLVFIDQLMNHFNWTGDTGYVKKMWPVIARHLAWEKRNFDADDDGLYDAYCCIWASDALQYSGGGVTHSSAYNYRIFKTAAELASMIGIDGSLYKKEAEKILEAINRSLWMPSLGWYAEYKDLLGEKQVHPFPGLWTIYHAIDAKLPDAFQAYQATRYVDTEIPHIPVKALGLAEDSLFLLSTSNWQPYTWSVNNVALAENLHMALAYWQANRPEEAYRLWKSALIESMYLGASPGGFQQLSFYDAIRGQLYRDFADPVGMAARTLVEGMFGILPDALRDTLTFKPGFPPDWEHAALSTPDIRFWFEKNKQEDSYTIGHKFPKPMQMTLQVRAVRTELESVLVDGKPAKWNMIGNMVGGPVLQIGAGKRYACKIVIRWKGEVPARIVHKNKYAAGDTINLTSGKSIIQSIKDPQNVLAGVSISGNRLQAVVQNSLGNRTVFVQLKQGAFTWWQPVCLEVKEQVEINTSGKIVSIGSNADAVKGSLVINKFKSEINIRSSTLTSYIRIAETHLNPGTNRVLFQTGKKNWSANLVYWDMKSSPATKFEKIDLTKYFNEKVTNIFKQQYLSPRPTSPTLQLPTQGIGNWCYPLTTAEISDSGLRAQAGTKNEIMLPQGIPFSTPGDSNKLNIIFTSQWDNFPDSVVIPLSGKSKHAYFMMAGSTNPMQSRMVNGEVRIHYTDGSSEILSLKNPENWWPVEQDFLQDGYAFTTGAPTPLRYYLKKGIATTSWSDYTTIRGFSNCAIDGGAATVLDLPLNDTRELKSLIIHTIANDVVIGLMSLTLVR
jgi:hypothetical protein